MKTQAEILKNERLKVISTGIDGGVGEIYFPAQREPMAVVRGISKASPRTAEYIRYLIIMAMLYSQTR